MPQNNIELAVELAFLVPTAEGYKTDLAEPHVGPGGADVVNEIKLWTPLLKTSSPGVGNASRVAARPPPLATPTPLATPKRRPAA